MAKANVLAFPVMQKVPMPELSLQGKAYDRYMELATRLLNARKLNRYTQFQCEQIALRHQIIDKRLSQGLAPSGRAMDELGKLMRDLQLVDESESIAPAPVGQENRFSRIGVIVRPGTQKAELRSS